MADLQSSVAQAKSAGYSGDEILAYLSKSRPDLNSKIQQARSAGYGVDDIVGHLATPKPSAASQIGDAASAFAGETAHLANPMTIATGAASLLAHPIDTLTAGMQGFRDKAVQDIKNGDYWKALNHGVAGVVPVLGPAFGNTVDAIDSGDASAVGRSAADLTAAKTVPAIYKGVGSAAGATVSGVKAAASNPYVQAVAPVVGEGVIKAAKELPVIGGVVKSASQLWDMAVKAQKAYKSVGAGETPADAPAPTAQTPSAPPQVSTKVQIPTKFSPESASDTMGTRAPSAAPEAASGLDQTTHQRLAEAVQSGKLQALPADAKASITQAVKAGDTTRVNAILDLGRDVSISELRHIASTNNKVAVLLKYATDHGIDIESVPPEARQAYADAAMAHAKQLGLTDLLSTNKSGRYTGTHESAFALMKAKLAAGQ